MKLLLIISMLFYIGCGTSRIEVTDSKHEIIHRVDLESAVDLIKDLCTTQLGEGATDAEVAQCAFTAIEDMFNLISNEYSNQL